MLNCVLNLLLTQHFASTRVILSNPPWATSVRGWVQVGALGLWLFLSKLWVMGCSGGSMGRPIDWQHLIVCWKISQFGLL